MNNLHNFELPVNKTKDIYLRRIGIAIEFIESRLDEKIGLEDVANASHFSPYHFHRIFHAIVGETINDFITRKRMERAAKRLVYQTQLSITEIAHTGGFSSSANFSKTFKLYFGISPKELRNPASSQSSSQNKSDNSKIGKLFRKYGKAFDARTMYSQFVTNVEIFDPDKLKELLMKVEVKDLPEKHIAYLCSPKGYTLEAVYSTWEKILQWGDNHSLDTSMDKRFAICHDNPSVTPEEKCRYDAAIVVDADMEIGKPINEGSIPGGKFAIAYFKDDASKINQFITEVCSQWCIQNGYEPDNFPPIFNYFNNAKEDGFVEMNVYIKIKTVSS